MIFHENPLPTDDSHKYHALFVIFEKAAKLEIVVCCKLYVALYELDHLKSFIIKISFKFHVCIAFINLSTKFECALFPMNANHDGHRLSVSTCGHLKSVITDFFHMYYFNQSLGQVQI